MSNPNLSYLNCGANQLPSLNLVANTQLGDLRCFNNQITSLDLTLQLALYGLHATQNQIGVLDLSNSVDLTFIDCSNNLLTGLNVKNGNNINLTNFIANNNPSLTCIQVDSVGYMNANWSTAKDTSASYNTNCLGCLVNIPDLNFKNELLSNPAINLNGNGEIECSEAIAFAAPLFLDNLVILDFTGLEAFVNIPYLQCINNDMSSIDLSANINLNHLKTKQTATNI
jgi:hypothetical protein